MFYIYANGKSIFQPTDEELVLFSPKLTLEMGKAGSLQFQIPPSNRYYNSLPQLTTIVTVEMDDVEIFRGRVLTNSRNFNNVRTVYCEGDLAYLVDSVQKAEKYDGKAHALFRKIIKAHNARVENAKRFTVGEITVEDRDVLLTGESEDIQDAETGKFDYKQIAINSIADEWQNTFDFIQECLINYTGGYLRTRRVGGTTYIDLLADYGSTSIQEIEFGKNLLDLTDEVSAEDVFTVLIPLGDENLTIKSVNNGSDELVDSDAVARYGRIVKTHVFDSVNNPSTLLENGRRYLSSHVNVPFTLTVKAIDMHLVDPNASPIYVGDKVHVNSLPHDLTDQLTCTKIEYDIENPQNNAYTFGTPKQSLTERYRKDKSKSESRGSRGGAGGAGGAGDAADEAAQENLDEFFDAWINVDKEAAHIDLGTLYKKFNEGKETLESYCGISLDAPSGNINIKTLRTEFDELGNTVKEQSAYIDLLNNELGARIALVAASHQALDDREATNHAELVIRANDLEAAIESNTEHLTTLDGQMTQSSTRITQLSDDLQAQITLEASHKREIDGKITESNTSISQLDTDLKAQIKLEADHKKELDGKISSSNTSIAQVASDLAAQIKLEAKHKTELDGKISESNTSISQLDTDLKAQIKLEAKHKTDIDGEITKTNASIKTVADDLAAQIKLEAKHNSDQGTKIASIEAKADANESAITLKADKTTIDSTITNINGRLNAAEGKITTLESDYAKIDTLISDKIKAITFESLLAKATVISATIAITSGVSVSAPLIAAKTSLTLGGKAVATKEWVEGKGYLTSLPSDISVTTVKASSGMSIGVQKVATQYWCISTKKYVTKADLDDILANYAKTDHTHSGYASSTHSHAWSDITGKPSSFKPAKHRHRIKMSIANGHTHKFKVAKLNTDYNTQGVSTNATHSIDTYTEYYTP